MAVDTILTAREIPVIVSTIPDQSLTPSVMSDERFADPAKRQLVSDAIRRVNAGITAMAAERGLSYLDFDAMYLSLLPLIEKGFTIEGNSINLFAKGDDPPNGILSDGIHPGTVVQGIVANRYLELINEALNLNIPLLTDAEIATAAGLS
jgi:phospholipase/lecithinase/hemolysin